MVIGFFRKLVLLLAVPIGAIALYAHVSGDTDLRFTFLSLLAMLCAAAFALGMFRRKRTMKRSIPMPATRQARPRSEPLQLVEPTFVPPEPEEETEKEEIKDDELYIVFSRLAGFKTGDAFRANIEEITSKNRLAPLSPDEIDRLANEIDKRDLRGKSFVRSPGVALVRMQRFDLDVEFGGTSWLGGLPTLGDIPWPRDDRGRAMHHLAQIDIGTVPDPLLPPGMPTTGALAFFMNTSNDAPYQSKTVYLPTIGNTATEPPEDLAPIYDGPDWGDYVKGYARENAPDTFPRWPVEFVLLPMADQNKDDDAHELMNELIRADALGFLSPMNYRQTVPDFARPWFWDTAHRFTMSIRLARDDIADTIAKAQKRVLTYGDQYQPDLDVLLNRQEAFSKFVDEVSIWAVSNEPWSKMDVADVEDLNDYFAQVREVGGQVAQYKPFYQFTQGELISVQEAAVATLVAAANAPPEVYAQLPFDVRDDIDTKHRIPSKGRWHQMFGLGTEIQSAVTDHTHHHMLLQLHSDQLMNWMWGDNGIVQFWITEDDMLQQNWDAVEMTLEGN